MTFFFKSFISRIDYLFYRRLLMVGAKFCGYWNSGRLWESEYSVQFFCTRHNPTNNDTHMLITWRHLKPPRLAAKLARSL